MIRSLVMTRDWIWDSINSLWQTVKHSHAVRPSVVLVVLAVAVAGVFILSPTLSDWIWDSINSLLQAVNPNVVLTVACVVMIYYFWDGFSWFREEINPVATDLQKANKVLSFAKDHEQSFFRAYEEISAQLAKIPNISHHWQEFKEHLILPTDDEATKQDAAQLKIRNSLPPSYFFSEEKFIERPIDLRYVDAVPGKLVALGVAFTFIGLTIGIGSATHTLGGLEGTLDTTELNRTLMQLLEGASFAFITSVLGISLSILFSWLEKRKIKDVKKSLNSFVDNLEKCLSFITSEQIHLDIRDLNKEQNKKLDGFSNELAISLGNAISKPLEANFNKMADAIVELKNAKQNFSDNLMNTLVDKMSGNISAQAQHNQQQAAATFAEVQQALAQQTETMVTQQNEMTASSQKLLDDINDSNQQNQAQMQQQLTSTLTQLSTMTARTTDEMQKNIVTSSQQMGQEMHDAFNRVVASMDRQQQKINDSIKNITDSISSTAHKMNEATASFEKLLAASNDNIEKNNSIQATYRNIVERQQDIATRFSEISQTIEDSNTHMSEASEQNKTVASALHDLAAQVDPSMQKMDTMWQAYDQKFKDTDATMSKNFNHFEKCTQQFHTTLGKYVSDLTKEFEKAISLLGDQIEELSEAMGDRRS